MNDKTNVYVPLRLAAYIELYALANETVELVERVILALGLMNHPPL